MGKLPVSLVCLIVTLLPGGSDAIARENAQSPHGSGQGRIVFFGDSLTAGYGVKPAQAFPALIEERLEKRGLDYEVVNAGVSGETSAGGLRRVDWVLREPVDIFVLALGGNDGLRGVDPASTRRNLQEIIDKVKAAHPGVELVIAGMRLPPNLGEAYTGEFRAVFPELARGNGATLIPFLLEDVGGRAELNLPDRIHPNAEGHKRIAETVWQALEPLLTGQRKAA